MPAPYVEGPFQRLVDVHFLNPPRITDAQGAPISGAILALFGQHFGASAGSVYLTTTSIYSESNAQSIVSWADTYIEVTLSHSSSAGSTIYLWVKSASGQVSNSWPLVVPSSTATATFSDTTGPQSYFPTLLCDGSVITTPSGYVQWEWFHAASTLTAAQKAATLKGNTSGHVDSGWSLIDECNYPGGPTYALQPGFVQRGTRYYLRGVFGSNYFWVVRMPQSEVAWSTNESCAIYPTS